MIIPGNKKIENIILTRENLCNKLKSRMVKVKVRMRVAGATWKLFKEVVIKKQFCSWKKLDLLAVFKKNLIAWLFCIKK